MSFLDQLDDEFDAIGAKPGKVSVKSLPCPELFNGFYTLTFPCGSQRTFRLSTRRQGAMAGKRVLGMLIGPQNTKDYEDFAFLTDTGFQTWKRFKNQRQADYAVILWAMMLGESVAGHELLVSARCLKCNRELTDELSIKTGIGPTCRKG